MTELMITYKKLDTLTGYANNTRTHSEEQITQLMNSIQEFGFTNPIIINSKGTIIAGHGRLEAAKALNMPEVPTIELSGLTETQEKALVIADNKIALNAGWDFGALKFELESLDDAGFDLDLTGFDDVELESIMDDSDFSEPEVTDLAEKKEQYDNADLKRIILIYNTDDFEEVHRICEPLLEELKLEDNSALFKFLIEKYIGDNRIDETN